MDGSPTDRTTRGQSGPGSNGNEEVCHIFQSLKTEASPSDVAQCHTHDTSSI